MELEEIFGDIKDKTDPSLMDEILVRYEETRSEAEEFIQLLIKKSHLMQVTWQQPWYQMSRSVTRTVKRIDGAENAFRTDPFSKDERKKIHKNWKKFRKMYNVPNTLICLARWRNKKCCKPTTSEEFVRRFVVSFLAQGLERTLCQVYKYIVCYYGGPVKGKLNQFEENMIDVCMYHKPQKAVIYLSAVLSRDARGLYKRISYRLNGKPEKKTVRWNLPMATKLLRLLMQYTEETVVDNLKNRQFEKSIWLKIEKDMGHQYVYLQHFWHHKLHVQLFVKADVKLKKLRRKIFKLLKVYPYKEWKDIRWKDIAKHFPDGFSHKFLYKICYTIIYHSFKDLLTQPLEDLISFGLERSKFGRNRRLKTLVLNEHQELNVIKYENKLEFNSN